MFECTYSELVDKTHSRFRCPHTTAQATGKFKQLTRVRLCTLINATRRPSFFWDALDKL